MRDYNSFFSVMRKKFRDFEYEGFLCLYQIIAIQRLRQNSEIYSRIFSVKCHEISIQIFRQNSDIMMQTIFDVNGGITVISAHRKSSPINKLISLN